MIELLESRVLLSTDVNLYGDEGADAFFIRRVITPSSDTVQIFQNQPTTATPTQVVPYADLGVITINGNGDDDVLTVDFSGGSPLAAAGNSIRFYGGGRVTPSGANPDPSGNELIVIGDSGNNTFTAGSGFVSLDGGAHKITTNSVQTVRFIGNGGADTLNITGGSYTFGNDLGDDDPGLAVEVGSGATAKFGATEHLSSLAVDSGGNAAMVAAGGTALVTNALTVNGTLDLASNDAIINYGANASPRTAIEADVARWVNSTGGGVIESSAASTTMTLGVADTATNWSAPTSLDGQAISANSLLIRYTLYGDTNLDGQVTSGDVGVVLGNYTFATGTATKPMWAAGDFRYDGTVDSGDLGYVLGNYSLTSGITPTQIATGQPYSLTLGSSYQGTPVLRWDVAWGDGEIDSYTGGTPSADHAYTQSNKITPPSPATPYYIPYVVSVTAITDSATIHLPPALLTVDDGTANTAVTLNGTSGLDNFTIGINPDTGDVEFTGGTNPVDPVDPSQLLSINIVGNGGGDVLTVDFSNGNPLPAAGLFFDGAVIRVIGTDSADVLVGSTTAAAMNDAVMRHPADTAIRFMNASDGDQVLVGAGTVVLPDNTDDTTGPAVYVADGATARFAGSQHLADLSIASGGTARMTVAGNHVLVTNALHMLPAVGFVTSALLDLNDNDMIVRSSTGLAGANGNQADIATLLANGYTTPAFTAQIISTIAHNDPAGYEVLGYALNADAAGTTPLMSQFDGESVTTTDVLIKFTWLGDANLDGLVNAADASLETAGVTNHLTGWSNGDFDYSGTIDSTDSDTLNAMLDSAVQSELLGGPITINEGSPFPTGTLPTTTPAGDPIDHWQIDWGDGSTATVLTPGDSAPVPAPGTQTVSLTAFDAHGDPLYRYPNRQVTVNLVAPAGLTATVASDGEIDLAWTNTTTIAGGTAIEVSTDGDNFAFFDEVAPSTTAYKATALAADTTYYFQIRNVYRAVSSAASSSASASTPAVPAPIGFAATAVSSTQINLSWSDSSAGTTAFDIDWSANGSDFATLAEVDPGTTTYQATGLTPGTAYSFRLMASDDSGQSSSADASATTAPSVPSGLSVVVNDNETVQLNWNLETGVTGFQVERDIPGSQYQTIGTTPADVTSFLDQTAPDTWVTYRVRALTGAGSTNPTPALAATVAPAAPSNLQASGPYSDGHFQLTWTESSTRVNHFEIIGDDQMSVGEFSSGVSGNVTTLAVYPGFSQESDIWFYRVRAVGLSPYLTQGMYSKACMVQSQWPAPRPPDVVTVPTTVEQVGGADIGSTGWINVSGTPVTYAQAFTNPKVTDTGYFLNAGTVLQFDFADGLRNGSGPDLAIFKNNWSGQPFIVSCSYDGYSASTLPMAWWNTTGFSDTFQQKSYGEIESASVDLTALGVPAGALVTSIRITVVTETGLVGIGGLQAPVVSLVPYRTGENFGQPVSESIIQSQDPSQYVILTNNNYDEHPDGSAKDYDDDTALIGTDKDLARITLKQIPSSFNLGTLTVAPNYLSNAPVRLFKSDGTELIGADRSLDLSNPTGYLAGLRSGNVDVWVEGLGADPDYNFNVSYSTPSGRQVGVSIVHIDIADLEFVGKTGYPVAPTVSTVSEQTLTDIVSGDPFAPTIPDADFFSLQMNGVASRSLGSVDLESADNPSDTTSVSLSNRGVSTSTGSILESSTSMLLYALADGADVLTTTQKQQVGAALGVNAIAGSAAKFIVHFAADMFQRTETTANIRVNFMGGSDKTDGTLEAPHDIGGDEPFIMKGYMLELSVDNQPNTPVTWKITKKGQNQQVGTFYSGYTWAEYTDQHKLPAVPTDGAVYWRSDFDGTGKIDDEYDVTATYTPTGAGPQVTATTVLKSRLLDPNDKNANTGYHTDADMVQRAIIQDFGLDKGHLQSYRIGQYDFGSKNGWYVSSSNYRITKWSSIADEVSNFRHFALGKAFSPVLTLDTLGGIWSEYKKIQDAPLPTRVDSTNGQFDAWIGQALASTGMSAPQNASVTSDQILRGLIKHESTGIHSYDVSHPLEFSSVQVGAQPAGQGDNRHQLTDWGLGFAKVQPYNSKPPTGPDLNLYDPAQNILRAAQMLNEKLIDKRNKETGDDALWLAYFAYNTGGFVGGTVTSVRAAALGTGPAAKNIADGATHADSFFDALNLPHP
jgi:hypothetical protein